MLLTQVKQPSLAMRAMLIGAQGVFFNLFFFNYILWPKTCHRFVGALEEEAVHTYSVLIKEIEAGRMPEWANMQAPQIAIDYWRLQPDASMKDVVYNVRADESQHRFVNHTVRCFGWLLLLQSLILTCLPQLANLDQVTDSNPFAIHEPSAEVKGTTAGFTREEAQAWTLKMEREAREALSRNTSHEKSL